MTRTRGYACNIRCPCPEARAVRKAIFEAMGVEVEVHLIAINMKRHKPRDRGDLASEFCLARRALTEAGK